jgi:chromosome segregation ATPase
MEAKPMTMDLGQLSQMATWLDEENRRSKSEVVQVQQRLGTQEGELQDVARSVKELEGRFAGMQAQLVNLSQFQAALQQLKEEVVHMLAQADERRMQEAREAERLRSVERDNLSRTLNELRRELQKIGRLEEEVGLRKAEQKRIGDSVLSSQQQLNALAQDVEGKLRSIPFLEDARQQASKRIAQLQQESLEALKRLEQHGSRLQTMGDAIQRHERDTAELRDLVTHLRADQRDFIEKQLLDAEHLKREVSEWFGRLEVFAKRMDGFTARMDEFTEAHRADRQVVEGIQRFQEQIRRDQAQVAELQRLGEERQKRTLEQWQEDNEKRWRKELLRWDHQWGEQDQKNRLVVDQFGGVETRLSRHRGELDTAWKLVEAQLSFQTQELRRWSGELTRLLDERPKKD